jgi:DNA-directed RNA polymerase beta subunit
MRFSSPTGAALLYCISRLIVRSDNTLLPKVETGFCSGAAYFSGIYKKTFVINGTEKLVANTLHLKNNNKNIHF